MPYTGRQLHQRVKIADARLIAAGYRLEAATRRLGELEELEAVYATVAEEELEEEDVDELVRLRAQLATARVELEEATADEMILRNRAELRRTELRQHQAELPPSDPDAMIPPPRRRRDVDGPPDQEDTTR